MGLFSSVSKRLTRQFIAIIVEEYRCQIKQKIVKNKDVLHVEEFTFDIPSKENLGKNVYTFLNTLQEEYDNTYIALFLNTLGQGIIPVCDTKALARFHVDEQSVKTVCVEKRFLMYATLIDVKWADKVFDTTGLDFVFSPFLVLNHFIQSEDIIPNQVTLYILNTNNALTIMIHKGKQLLYGSFFNVAKEENLLYTDYDSDDNEPAAFDEIEIDEVEDMELDALGSVSDNSHYVNHMIPEQVALSAQDARLVKYLSASLKEFYSNDLYKSEFITAAKVFDGAGIDDGVMGYIENELLLDTSAKNISVRDVILTLAMKEATE